MQRFPILFLIVCAWFVLENRPVSANGMLSVPAAPHHGVRAEWEGTKWGNAQFGEIVPCTDIERQVVILNPEIVLGEPLMIRIALRSLSPGIKRELSGKFDFSNDLQALIYPPEGYKPYRYPGLKLGATVPNSVVEFETQSVFRLTQTMAMDDETITGAAFDLPGEYTIRILLACNSPYGENPQSEMGTFKITVKEPTGDDEKALDILSEDYTIFKFFQLRGAGPGEHLMLSSRQKTLLERLVQEAPEAALRPHALLILADYEIKFGDWKKGEEILLQVDEQYQNSPFEDLARINRLKAYIQKGMIDEGKEYFLDIWQDPYLTTLAFPRTMYWGPYVSRISNYNASGQWMIMKNPQMEPESIKDEGTMGALSEAYGVDEETLRNLGLDPNSPAMQLDPTEFRKVE